MPTSRASRKAAKVVQYMVDRTTLFIFYLSMASMLIEFALHAVDMPTFANQYLIFLAFESSIIVTTQTKQLQVVEAKAVNWFTIAWVTGVTVVGIFVIQGVIGYLMRIKLALADWEIYLFYINAALAEEALYRVTLITFLDKLFVKMPFFHEQPLVRKLVLVIVSASVFGLSHYWVYGQQPALMLVAFLAGILLALSYVLARNPLPPVIAHVTNNLLAANQIVQSMSILSMVI